MYNATGTNFPKKKNTSRSNRNPMTCTDSFHVIIARVRSGRKCQNKANVVFIYTYFFFVCVYIWGYIYWRIYMYISFLIMLEVIYHDTRAEHLHLQKVDALFKALLLIACHSCISCKYKNYTKQYTQLYMHIYWAVKQCWLPWMCFHAVEW